MEFFVVLFSVFIAMELQESKERNRKKLREEADSNL